MSLFPKDKMSERVVVAMSGGVDSSVAAAILEKKGFEVIGVTMCFNLPDSLSKKPSCCGLQGIEDARRVAHKIGIKHYVLNMQKFLEESVIRNFCLEYQKGRTPNPCIRCNQYIKFSSLLKKALSLDAKFLATGHYARITKVRNYCLRKASDLKKDQSYFLYRLNQEQLKHILFPLGGLTKDKVRALAEELGLPVAGKKDSQEICFLPDNDYRNFLQNKFGNIIMKGPILDAEGNILGQHKGIAYYTFGQRQGLGVAKGYPVYIIKIDPVSNSITVGTREQACKREFLVKEVSFIKEQIKKKVALKVKIRYNHKESPAQLTPEGRSLKVSFKSPQFAVTPGQSAVFYDKDKVVGGGIIDKVLD